MHRAALRRRRPQAFRREKTPDLRAEMHRIRRFLRVQIFSMRQTAWAAIPEPSPVKPSFSSVVPLTFT